MPNRTDPESSEEHRARLSQEYRPVAIGAVAAALCIKGKREPAPARRAEEEALLRRFDLAA